MEKGKITLVAVNGSYTHTNLAVRCLRESLEENGFDVLIIECNLRDRNLHVFDKIVNSKADIVGFSCYIWNIQTMLSLASDLKAVSPETKIIFGGPEVSFDTERFQNLPFIDAVICGEGEDILPELCEKMLNGTEYSKINRFVPLPGRKMKTGIIYREEEFRKNNIPVEAMLYYESSRGCPFKCAYCLSSATDCLVSKSAEETLDDLLKFETFGKINDENNPFKIIKFVDRTFNFNIERANTIWKGLLSDKYTKNYHFEICPSLLNEESFEILSMFPKGKIQLECGLQSTNRKTLDAVSRHIDSDKTLENVKRIHDMGNIHIHLDLIAGLPYESFQRFGQSFNDAYYCCDLLQLGFLKLLHGTELRNNAEKYKISFRQDPPYTVLKTDWMTYGEVAELTYIAETLERFRESGKFNNTLSYILDNYRMPFEFYRDFTKYIMETEGKYLQKISQFDAYGFLFDYGIIVLGNNHRDALEEKIHMDYDASETRKMPLNKIINRRK